MNLNYVSIVKQNINKLLATNFIKSIEEAIWLSPIMVVPQKNGKLKIYVDLRKFNVATNKEPYLLTLTNEVINTIVGHEVYTFLDGFSGYHHILIAPKDLHKTTFVIDWAVFCVGCDVIWCQKWTTYLSKGNNQSISWIHWYIHENIPWWLYNFQWPINTP